MADFTKTFKVSLQNNQSQIIDFGGEAKTFRIENEGTKHVEVFLLASINLFGDKPAFILPGKSRLFGFSTTKVKLRSEAAIALVEAVVV